MAGSQAKGARGRPRKDVKPDVKDQLEDVLSDDAEDQQLSYGLAGAEQDSDCSDADLEELQPASQQSIGNHRPGGTKRSYADLLGGSVDDATLRTAYRTLAGQRCTERASVASALQQQATSWHLMLRAGFSVLLHGLGSKRHILEKAAEEQLTDGAVVTCNGWVKGLTAHKVLAAAATALLGRNCRAVSSADILKELRAEAKQWPERRVYIVLHSIDGPGLRNEPDQALLAALAACPNCHLIASADHINTALLWSSAVAAQFKWFWSTAHTYAPLVAETLDVPSALLSCYQRSQQRGAGAVLRSMVASARAAYGLLVDVQRDDPSLEGLDFKQLFRMCRERFLYTSEPALRAALTEFIDHELLATRPSSDGGGELLYVPLDAGKLDQVAQELLDLQAEAAAQ